MVTLPYMVKLTIVLQALWGFTVSIFTVLIAVKPYMVTLPYMVILTIVLQAVWGFITSIFTVFISVTPYSHITLYDDTYHSPSSSLGVHRSHLHTPYMVTLPYIVILIIVLQAVWGFITSIFILLIAGTPYMVTLPYMVKLTIVLQAVWGFTVSIFTVLIAVKPYMVTLPYMVILTIVLQAVWGFITSIFTVFISVTPSVIIIASLAVIALKLIPRTGWYKKQKCTNPAHTTHLYNIYAMVEQRRRRWTDVV